MKKGRSSAMIFVPRIVGLCSDRVQGDMTLYARWIHARVDYVDAASKTVLFSKNVTTRSTIQPLSPAAEQLVTPGGQSLYGYFADESCTTPLCFPTTTSTPN